MWHVLIRLSLTICLSTAETLATNPLWTDPAVSLIRDHIWIYDGSQDWVYNISLRANFSVPLNLSLSLYPIPIKRETNDKRTTSITKTALLCNDDGFFTLG